MGTSERNFALCRKCVDALTATLDDADAKVEREAEGFAPQQMLRVRGPR